MANSTTNAVKEIKALRDALRDERRLHYYTRLALKGYEEDEAQFKSEIERLELANKAAYEFLNNF